MALAREDKHFLLGLAIVLALLLLYFGPGRIALSSRVALLQVHQHSLKEENKRFFHEGGQPISDTERTLADHERFLAERLREVHGAVVFDPAAIVDPLDPAADPHGGPDRYLQLSRSLHEKLKADLARLPNPPRLPSVFDPQGDVRAPDDPARVPDLHRQLLVAYSLLRRALDARVDILDLRSDPARGQPSQSRHLDGVRVSVKAEGTLDELAAFLHALSRAPKPPQRSQFLRIERLLLARSSERPELLQAELTLATLGVNPDETAEERR
jgi:hypothetical protein